MTSWKITFTWSCADWENKGCSIAVFHYRRESIQERRKDEIKTPSTAAPALHHICMLIQ